MSAWSFTRLKAYENCSLKGHAMYVDKAVPYVESPEMKKGNDIHKAIELAIKGGAEWPGSLGWVRELTAVPLEHKVEAEWKFSIDRDGGPVPYFDKSVWFRGAADFVQIIGDTAIMLDWKTGKRWEDPDELFVHATLLKRYMPHLTQFVGFYVWTQDREVGKPYVLTPDLDALRMRVTKVEGLTPHPTPNKLCGWCGYLKCPHNPKR